MKIKIDDLEKAIKWMKIHSPDPICNLTILDTGGIQITCKDRYAKYVEMRLSQDGNMSPKIIKEEDIP